jgi:exodeoxyribonuclease VIII
MPIGEYHAHPAISKSGLWTLYTQTPAHQHFGKIETTNAMDLGTAAHIAILEPHRFEASVLKGPDDRRGNKWKDVADEAMADGKIPLTSGDFEKALCMRDSAQMLPDLRRLTDGKQVREASGFWIDAETGMECRCRPDLYHPGLEIMADLKTTSDASASFWTRNAANLGYHFQDAIYSEGWPLAGGGAVDGFFFINIETDPPFSTAMYEFTPSAVAEGRAIMRKALAMYKRCKEADAWPGYPQSIQEIDIPRWAYRETEPLQE